VAYYCFCKIDLIKSSALKLYSQFLQNKSVILDLYYVFELILLVFWVLIADVAEEGPSGFDGLLVLAGY